MTENTAREPVVSEYDRSAIHRILTGEGSWFTAHLLRLIARCDLQQRNNLATLYPDAVALYEEWARTGSPMGWSPGSTLPAMPESNLQYDLKCWPESYEAILHGRKRAEIRVDDRPEGPYEVGALLQLREWVREPSLEPRDPVHGQLCEWVHPNGHRFATRYSRDEQHGSGIWYPIEAPCLADPAIHPHGVTDQAAEHVEARRVWISHLHRENGEYTGRRLFVGITDVLRNFKGILPGYAMLSLSDVLYAEPSA